MIAVVPGSRASIMTKRVCATQLNSPGNVADRRHLRVGMLWGM